MCAATTSTLSPNLSAFFRASSPITKTAPSIYPLPHHPITLRIPYFGSTSADAVRSASSSQVIFLHADDSRMLGSFFHWSISACVGFVCALTNDANASKRVKIHLMPLILTPPPAVGLNPTVLSPAAISKATLGMVVFEVIADLLAGPRLPQRPPYPVLLSKWRLEG